MNFVPHKWYVFCSCFIQWAVLKWARYDDIKDTSVTYGVWLEENPQALPSVANASGLLPLQPNKADFATCA